MNCSYKKCSIQVKAPNTRGAGFTGILVDLGMRENNKVVYQLVCKYHNNLTP